MANDIEEPVRRVRRPAAYAVAMSIAVSDQGTTSTIELVGEFDLAQEKPVDRAIRGTLRRRPECLVLDLSRVSFIGSSGIRTVVKLAKRATELNVRLVIVQGPTPVQRAFEICRLTDSLPFVTEHQAKPSSETR